MRGGSIEVICGGMFSGKTEELLRRVRREQFARRKVQLFKHSLDQRYTDGHVESHAAAKLPAYEAKTADAIREQLLEEAQVIAIDEVQFFDETIVDLANELADSGLRVVLAGLDMDYKGVPFGPMPQLLAIAEDVTKIHAVCVLCGEAASRSHRLSREGESVQVGAAESYEARCRSCDKAHVCSLEEIQSNESMTV